MPQGLWTRLGLGAGVLLATALVLFSFPTLLKTSLDADDSFSVMQKEFPVTVNPQDKTITENPQVEAFLVSEHSPLQAAAGNMSGAFWELFSYIAVAIANSTLYQNAAQSVAAVDERFVSITPGMRKEQVANAFAKVLGWNAEEKKQFLTPATYASLPLSEGSFSPGIYLVERGTTPLVAQAMVNDRFSEEILSHYSDATAQVVPVQQALIIASLIEREAGGADDMRYISGVIWNRLFINMRLQIDATVQYAKANTNATSAWWPRIVSGDQNRKSPYNTYLNKGLPPGPIANPSVASVIAALNPKKTSCLFYFHTDDGAFHCTNTYADHVALLKKFYGRGR
jgi:cell division protein YceG involved in septum cleavage